MKRVDESMHMKRNLTLAVALGLLAVPAFNSIQSNNILPNLTTTSVSANSIINANQSQINNLPNTSHGQIYRVRLTRPVTADNVYQNPKGDYLNKIVGHTTFPAGDIVQVYEQGTNGIGVNISDASHPVGQNDIEYTFPVNDSASEITSSMKPISNIGSVTQSNTTNSNKNTLPQTGEVNNQAKQIVSSILLGATGIGLSAISLKKRKNQKKLANINTISGTTSNNSNNEINLLLDNIKSNTDKLNNYASKINNK